MRLVGLNEVRSVLRKHGWDGLAKEIRVRACSKFGCGDLQFRIEKTRQISCERQYAHVGHARGKTICVTRDIVKLPRRNRLGILWHEVGHFLSDVTEVEPDRALLREAERIYDKSYVLDQALANTAALVHVGVRIRYDKNGVQHVD